MDSLKAMHKAVRDTLYGWNYSPTDIVHTVDLGYAIYHCIDTMSCLYQWHVVCMCIRGEIVDYGDGLYGINEATNE